VQAVNEFAVFGSQAFAALGSGWIVSELGWSVLQWFAIPLLLITALLLIRQWLTIKPELTA